jgi:PhnB protein
MSEVKPVPEGLHSVTPGLTVQGASAAIDFYQKAFGAQELRRFPTSAGVIMHAEIRIGDSVILINDEVPEMGLLSPLHYGGPSSALTIHSPDADAIYAQAVEAGATPLFPIQDTFTGDRYGVVKCPFGHRWIVAIHVEDVSTEEIQRRLDGLQG